MLIDKKSIYKQRYLWLSLCGFLLALPLIIPSLGFLQWVAFVPVAILLYICSEMKLKKKQTYLYGFVFFMCYYVTVFHWFFYMYPMEFAGIGKGAALVVVIVATLGVALVQSIFSSWLFVLFNIISKSSVSGKYPIIKILMLPSLWVIFEWWQTVGWWGVPWGRLCIGQADYLFTLQSASIFGSYFVSFIIVCVNSLMAYAMLDAKKAKAFCIAAVGIIVFNTLFGGIYMSVDTDKEENKIKVAAIQGNIDSDDKWASGEEAFFATYNAYEEYTRMAAEEGAKIIVWPETALPYNFFQNSYGMVYRVSALAKECNVTILVSAFTEEYGASYTDKGNDGLYNSVIMVNPDGSFGEKVYSKQHLVPFGEFVPMETLVMTLIPPLAEIQMLDRDLLQGSDSEPLVTEDGNITCGICFDSIYEKVILDGVRAGGELISISTNDAWFKDSRALYMHNTQSSLRAIETGRYVVRAANTGISTIISPNGEVLELCPALTGGYVSQDVYMRSNTTVYTVIGNLFVYICMAFVGALSVVWCIDRYKYNKLIKDS